jgi:hypothetical protein
MHMAGWMDTGTCDHTYRQQERRLDWSRMQSLLQPVVDLNFFYYKTHEGLIKNIESDSGKQVPAVLACRYLNLFVDENC